jgi:hypothetical protein
MEHLVKPFSAEFQNDPYPTYRRLQNEAPVYCANLLGARFYVLTRYADVLSALRDPRLSAQAAGGGLLPPALCSGNLFFKDPPEHTRLRNLINRAFLPQTVESMRPQVAACVDQVIDDALRVQERQGHFDVVHDLGMRLSLGTILSILGLPVGDCEKLKRWTDALAVLLDATQILPGLAGAHRAAAEVMGYFDAAFSLRKKAGSLFRQDGTPRDLLCGLLAARQEQDKLTDEELIVTAMFTLMAGHETVTSAVASGLLLLFQNPAELARLRSDPALIPTAFDEMLRYDPPGQMTTKTAKEDLVIGGQHIEKGRAVLAVLAAANRDPEQFPDPDRFDIGRRENRHLSFGQGPHYCVGAALARMQGQLLLAGILRRMPGLRIDPAQAERKPGIVLRGLRRLPARA